MLSNNTFSEWWPVAFHAPINEAQRPSTLYIIVSILTAKNVALIVTGLFFLDILYNIFFHPLRRIPGPFLAKFSHTWRNHKYFRGTWHDDTLELHRKYGKVVRIAPGEVSFVDEHGLKNLYGHGKQVLKTKWYDSWIVPNMTVSFFAATDIKVHRHLRSRVSGAYSMTSILSMEPLVQDVLDLNIRKLGEFADRGEIAQMDKWANYFTFDVVGKLAMGGTIGFLEQGKDVDGIIRSIHDGFYLMANMGNVPFQMFWINNPVAKWFVKTLGGERLNAFDIFLDWLEERVEERMKHGLQHDQRRDMLQHYIEAKDPQGLPVKKGDVMIEGVNILGAGADTTTIGILAILGSLITNPEAKQKLQQEIDQAYQDMDLDKQHREITFKEAENLPYLSAVVCESTRLHPSIQYQLPRHAPAEGVQIGPYYVPPGSVCGISPRSMNRCEDIFGSDADAFRPERWIAQGPEDVERIKRQTSLLTTFGMGSRSCVGRHLATVEMYKYIAQFFRHFDAEPVRPERPWNTKTQWFAFQREFPIKIKRRSHGWKEEYVRLLNEPALT